MAEYPRSNLLHKKKRSPMRNRAFLELIRKNLTKNTSLNLPRWNKLMKKKVQSIRRKNHTKKSWLNLPRLKNYLMEKVTVLSLEMNYRRNLLQKRCPLRNMVLLELIKWKEKIKARTLMVHLIQICMSLNVGALFQ